MENKEECVPGGDDLDLCARARQFSGLIENVLVNFSEKYGLAYTPWYHDTPLFILEWPNPYEDGCIGIRRAIQVRIQPESNMAAVHVMGHAFNVNRDYKPDTRRIRSFFFFNGQLPRDADRIEQWLKAAVVILGAMREDDLLGIQKWQETQSKLVPLFSTAED